MINKKLKYEFCLLSGFLLCVVGTGLGFPNGNNNIFTDKLIAKVGEKEIRFDDYFRRYTDFLISTGSKDNPLVRKAILNNMINEELLLHYDHNNSFELEKNYLTDLEWAKKGIVLAYLKDQEIYAKISISENELRSSFERANERIAARHLYAQTEEEVNNLYELLKIGVSFEQLAQQTFTDTVLRNNGGYLGYFTWGDMDPAFEDQVFMLKVGEISKPVKTAHGYSIIKLEDRVSHPLITETQYLQKKSYIERIVKLKKKALEEQKYIQNIFYPEKVVFNSTNLKKVLTEVRGVSSSETKKTKGNISICAKYERKSYSNNEIIRRIEELSEDIKMKIRTVENLQGAIRGFILQDKLLQIAQKKGYHAVPAVLQAFEKNRKVIFLKYKIDEITNAVRLPDSVLLDYYNTNQHLFSSEKEMNVQEIIVSGNELADSIKNVIVDGADVGTVAAKYSERTWSAKNNGVMGYSPLSKYGQLKDTLWSSQIGSVIGPITIQNRLGIFKLLGKKESEPIEFHLVKDQVKGSVKIEKQKTTVQEYLHNLQNKIKVEINEHQLMLFNVTELASQQ